MVKKAERKMFEKCQLLEQRVAAQEIELRDVKAALETAGTMSSEHDDNTGTSTDEREASRIKDQQNKQQVCSGSCVVSMLVLML